MFVTFLNYLNKVGFIARTPIMQRKSTNLEILPQKQEAPINFFSDDTVGTIRPGYKRDLGLDLPKH